MTGLPVLQSDPVFQVSDRTGLAATDWDAPGMLSIVVQGALFQGNMIETANHCRHWRDIFPHAEIILVLSLSDVVAGTRQDGVFTSLRLVAKHRHDGHLAAALDIILAACDMVGMGESALPLPPIKNDTPKLNNMNLQLAAAKHGLSLAHGKYVLRIRSDLIFLDRSFIQQYAEGIALPRGEAAVFTQRVLISWLYTLNPFTVERMPLHFSDWFHFGLTDDVRRIWRAPPITLGDSMYYRTHPHDRDSNALERLFNIRIAVEQHIIYSCFKDSLADLTLAYHNDLSSVNLAMDILIDNFIVCNLVQAHCVFNKYAHEFFDPGKRLQCITAETWSSLAHDRPADYQAITEERWQAMSQPLTPTAESDRPREPALADTEEAFQLQREFPRVYGGGRLQTKIGRLVNGKIVASQTDGVLVYGPYVTLEPGRYVAVLSAVDVQGPGIVALKVTINAGNTVLARRRFRVGANAVPNFRLAFDVLADVHDLEVVCDVKGLRTITACDVTIAKPDGSARPAGSRLRAWLLAGPSATNG